MNLRDVSSKCCRILRTGDRSKRHRKRKVPRHFNQLYAVAAYRLLRGTGQTGVAAKPIREASVHVSTFSVTLGPPVEREFEDLGAVPRADYDL